jgi:hypothetical protein
MSATSKAHAQELQLALNYYAGEKPDYVKELADFPRPPYQAVIWFTAYQIYLVNGLDKLASYSCNVVTVTGNLPEDSHFAGTATVSPVPATGTSLLSVFGWLPEVSPGSPAPDWQKAFTGELRLVGGDHNLRRIRTKLWKSTRGVWRLEEDKKP